MLQVIAVLATVLAAAFLVVGLGIYLYVRFVVARRRPDGRGPDPEDPRATPASAPRR